MPYSSGLWRKYTKIDHDCVMFTYNKAADRYVVVSEKF